jgi:branched-chain amino acid transport system substrate-binding protein
MGRLRVQAVVCALAGAATIAVLAGCGSSVPETTVATADDLVIYSALPEHGPQAPRARDVLDGERLALLLADGRAGRFHVQLRPLDDSDPKADPDEIGWKPDQTLKAAKAAIQDPGTIAYIGDFDNGATALSLPQTNQQDLLQVSPASTYAGFTGGPGSAPGEPDKYQPSGAPSFGQIAAMDPVQARAIVSTLVDGGCQRLAILRAPDGFDDSLGRLIARDAASRDLKVVLDEQVRDEDADAHARTADEVVKADAECATFVGGTNDAPAGLVGALHNADPTLQIVLPMALADDDVAADIGPASQATTIVGPPPPDDRFAAAFTERFGRKPGPWAAYGYEAMRRVLRAISVAGSKGNDRRAVVDAYLRQGPPEQRLALWDAGPTGLILREELPV